MLGVRVTPCWKVYIGGRRLHHGMFGLWLIAAGVWAVVDDRRDFPWPVRDAK